MERGRGLQRLRVGRWRYAPSVFVIVAGGALSVVLLFVFRANEEEDMRLQLLLEAGNHTSTIRRTLDEEKQALVSVRALFAASERVERREFRAFVQPILSGVVRTETMVWAPEVPEAGRAAFEAEVSKELGRPLRITQLGPEGKLTPSSKHPVYFPILYVEPMAGNETAMGFDFGSNEVQREAIDRARDSGKITATSETTAVAGAKRVVMLVAPVFAGRTPQTSPSRQRTLEGVIVGSVPPSALFASALKHLPREALAVDVFDRAAPAGAQLLYCSAPRGLCPHEEPDGKAKPLRKTMTLDVGWRPWEVVFTALPAFEAAHRTWTPVGVLLAGLALTALAGAYLISSTRHYTRERLGAQKLLEANRELTREIAYRREAEEERRRLEEQVRHAQKLESLGVLAGGIAHDFNNILMGVLGNAELALTEVTADSPVRESLEEIRKSATRAADLCRQMLAYSGKGRFVVEPVDLSEVVREMAHMLEVSISKDVELKYDFADDLPAVEADVTQIRQVVMNLITNASEAIGEGAGTVDVRTSRTDADRQALSETYLGEDLPEGTYVVLEVSDTGCGMDAETRAKMFDPFFSTKFAGRGLGLAALLGIVRGHRGAVKVDSEVGRGTTVTVLLPASDKPAVTRGPAKPSKATWHGSGTVLLADDEAAVRAVGRRMLEAIGLDVVAVADGAQAVQAYRRDPGRFDCVILDLTMPGMGGGAAMRELREIDPKVRVILTSGYDEQEVTARFGKAGIAGFVHKPYRLEDLAWRMKQVLEGDS